MAYSNPFVSTLINLHDFVEAPSLLNLLVELRNHIYSLVLSEPNEIIIPPFGACTKPALLRVCNQIRQEATQLYYAHNDFRAIITDEEIDGALQWLAEEDPKMKRRL